MKVNEALEEAVREFVLRDFEPQFGAREASFSSNPLWKRLKELGSELWLDTGSIDESGELWTQEFSALTTNNTLLNNEGQRGQYDALIPEACEMLIKPCVFMIRRHVRRGRNHKIIGILKILCFGAVLAFAGWQNEAKRGNACKT